MGKFLQNLFDDYQAWLCQFGDLACMDGHGGYVWLSYALTLVVLVLGLWLPIRAHRLWMAHEAHNIKRQQQYEEHSR